MHFGGMGGGARLAAAVSRVRLLRMLDSRRGFQGSHSDHSFHHFHHRFHRFAFVGAPFAYAARRLRQLLAQGVDALWTAVGQRLRRLRLLALLRCNARGVN